MKKNEPEQFKLSDKEFNDLKSSIENSNLKNDQKDLLVKALQGMIWLSTQLERKKMSLRKLGRLFGFKTEKKNKTEDRRSRPTGKGGGKKSQGHGRNKADDIDGAKRVYHAHDELNPKDRCPDCGRGNLYEIPPGIFVHYTGSAPLQAEVHELQKLRCSGCGKIFTAQAPKELRAQKYDETVDVSIALLKYSLGIPFNRLSDWQKYLGLKLSPSVLWERAEALGSSVFKVFEYLKLISANGVKSFIDDTGNKIINLQKDLKKQKSKRCGVYTTGMLFETKFGEIKLFITGNRYAGENLDLILNNRDESLSPMIKMNDALANNNLKINCAIESLCNVHNRRGYKDAEESYPKAVSHVIKLIGKIYLYDKKAKKLKLSNEERLQYHQKKSALVMKKLRRFCLKMLYLKKVDPADPLGMAIQYTLRHWKGLTEFLRTPGVELDNNAVERILKKAILNRKNAYFYKTLLGAYVGDAVMSLVETCKSAGKNPFDYLLALHRNKKSVQQSPEKWLPWNFEANLSI